MISRDLWIETGGEKLRVTVSGPDADTKPTVLSVHGAGPSGRERVAYLAEPLAAAGRGMVRFDLSGHGESSGDMKASSLNKRLAEALAMLPLLDKTKPLTLIGTSMGGHVVSRLLKGLNVANLILFCPAIYADEAEDIPFGEERFTQIIRREGSYRQSSVWEQWREFNGKVLLVIGEDDEIIPGEVIDIYAKGFAHADLEVVRISGAPHQLHGWFGKNPAWQEKVVSKILELVA